MRASDGASNHFWSAFSHSAIRQREVCLLAHASVRTRQHRQGASRTVLGLGPHVLTGNSIIKISLKTGDNALACRRWFEVHSQIEVLIEQTAIALKNAITPSERKPSSIDANGRTTLAGQARHDVLADNDADWTNPENLTPLAHGLEQALRLRDAGKLTPTGSLSEDLFFRHLAQFPIGMTRDQICVAARQIEADGVADMLRTGSTWPLDAPISLVEEIIADPNAPDGQRVVASTQLCGELSQRLDENGFAADAIERRKASHAVLMAKAAGFQDIEARTKGRAVETPPRPTSGRASERQDNFPTILEMHDIWAKRIRPDDKTKADNWLYIDRFISMHGNLRVDRIERRHVREFRDELEKYPSAMPAHIAKRSFVEIVAWAESSDAPRLSRWTVNSKGLGSLSVLLGIAVVEFDLPGDPTIGFRLPIKDCDVLDRHPFTPPLLQKIRASPVFQNPPKVSKGGCGAAAFWMPLISLYSGARLEEIGQLPLNDILEESGITYFWFREETEEDTASPRRKRRGKTKTETEKSIKTKAGRRRVPIHPILVELGLLEYLAARRAAGDKLLFPQLEPYRGRYTKNWSRWWARYQDRYVTEDESFVFHSFRHTFIGRMRAARIPLEFQKAIVGHARELEEKKDIAMASDVTEDYGDAVPITILNEEIQKISYPGLKFERFEAFSN